MFFFFPVVVVSCVIWHFFVHENSLAGSFHFGHVCRCCRCCCSTIPFRLSAAHWLLFSRCFPYFFLSLSFFFFFWYADLHPRLHAHDMSLAICSRLSLNTFRIRECVSICGFNFSKSQLNSTHSYYLQCVSN